MCLAIPGRVIRWVDTDPISGVAEVEFGGVRRECHMACVPEAVVGDFVIIHAGVALSIVDAAEADRVLAELASLPNEQDETQGETESGEAESAEADG